MSVTEENGGQAGGHPPSAETLKQLAETAMAHYRYRTARKLLAAAVKFYPEDVWMKRQLAFCTFRDDGVPQAVRFSGAAAVLEEIGLRDPETKDAAVLNLGGDIFKGKWETGGQTENLYEALAFYRAAFERNPEEDMGYGGVNAAYILQILTSKTKAAAVRTGTAPVESEALASQADDLRKEIVRFLSGVPESASSPEQKKQTALIMAEAHFGLGEYAEAEQWLARILDLKLEEWELQRVFRQLVSIARLQGVELPAENAETASWHPAWVTLMYLLLEDTASALSCFRGKVGLALSGGGFRASLYHIGVLARLAEIDALRSVEALSTVSGGSIVGAHYYLKVRHLLQTRKDGDIRKEDYIRIIKELQEEFLAGVQRNIRTRTLADFRKNLDMIFKKSYSRSYRLGELYESELYRRIQDGHPDGAPRYMKDLFINPKGHDDGFHPKVHNWRRRAKAPILMLNATTLNTGHNWQFTASFMGEPPGLIGGEVDKNSRYRRLYYHQAPTQELRDYRLGCAVAASACVPGLFDPLPLDGLYPDRTVQLVDGGVHDNQGVEGLLDEGCDFIICSDASGQMEDVNKPSNGIAAVLLRSNSIIMDRVRETEFQNLTSMKEGNALRGLFFVHLKKDLHVAPQDWIDCQDPTPASALAEQVPGYGVAPEIQRLIAGIRTDLDSFTEVEAYALMCSGYLMAEDHFKALQREHEKNREAGTWGGFAFDAPRGSWEFLKMESVLTSGDRDEPARADLEAQLNAAKSLMFKIWRLDPKLRAAAGVAGFAALVILGLLIKLNFGSTVSVSFTVGGLLISVAVAAAAVAVPVLKWISPQKAVKGIVQKSFLALFGYAAAKIHLWKFDRMFLERGKLARLLKLKGK